MRRGFCEIFIESDPVDDVLRAAFGMKPSKIFENWGFETTKLHRQLNTTIRGRPDFVIMKKSGLQPPLVQPVLFVAPVLVPKVSDVRTEVGRARSGGVIVLRLEDVAPS